MSARHEILGGKVQLYRRPGGRFWQCSTSIGGDQHRATTKKEELSQAEDAAEEWFLELRGMFKRGELDKLVPANAEKTFKDQPNNSFTSFRSSPRDNAAPSTPLAT